MPYTKRLLWLNRDRGAVRCHPSRVLQPDVDNGKVKEENHLCCPDVIVVRPYTNPPLKPYHSGLPFAGEQTVFYPIVWWD